MGIGSRNREFPPPSQTLAEWHPDGDAWVVGFVAGSVREALSPVTHVLGAILGVATAAIAAAAGQVALLVGLYGFAAYLAISALVYQLRLTVDAHPVVIRIGTDHVEIEEGERPVVRLRLREVTQFVVVHDGAPSRVRIDAGGLRFRRTIGQVPWNSSVEQFIGMLPEALTRLLLDAGLSGGVTVKRRIRTTRFRSHGPSV